MAKATMGTSRFKIQRRIGIELPGLGKAGALERRPYGPGQHGQARKKASDFSVRLIEKQKIIFHYGLREEQLVHYIKITKSHSAHKNIPWVDLLIINLERRLDNVVFRLNWAPSMAAARQMVSHGQVKVNGKRIDKPNYQVHVGEEIELTDRGYGSGNYLQAMAKPRLSSVPACYNVTKINDQKQKAKLAAMPLPEDIPFEFHQNLFIEYYWKLK